MAAPQPVFLDADGGPLEIRGYAAVFDQWSCHIPELDDQPERILPSAFDWVLARVAAGQTSLPLFDLGHDHRLTFVTAMSAVIELWTDELGLAFAISDIAATCRAAPYVGMIARGQMSRCSIEGDFRHSSDAGPGKVVDRVVHLGRIAITDRPAYAGTACWISSASPADLRRADAARMMASWSESRPA